jgi:hypothetical protein
MGELCQSRQAKFGEKGEKYKNKIFFSKDAPLIHFIHPEVQKYVQKCLKIAPNVIKINSIPIEFLCSNFKNI